MNTDLPGTVWFFGAGPGDPELITVKGQKLLAQAGAVLFAGSLVDRAGFLKQTAQPIAIKNLKAEDVLIRIIGDFAIIHARTTYLMPDGSAGSGRYTDVWAKIGGQWLAVSAHVTR